jgi:hypothetical protein
MEIVTEIVKVTTTGSAGAAVGNTNSPAMHGFLLDIYFDWHTSAPNTTDTTVSFKDHGGNVVVVTNSATDVLITPRAKPVDNANAAIANAHAKFPINGQLNVALAGCDALTDALVAYIRYLRI